MKQIIVSKLFSLLAPLLVVVLISVFIIVLAGESPITLWSALTSSLSSEGLGYSLFYATPFILTGLSVSLSFQVGLFNIGAEGQLYMGSIGIIIFSSLFPNLHTMPFIFGILSAMAAGALWGALAGVLKAWRGAHEVIVTILLNFIAYAVTDYLILYQYKDPASQSPETGLIATQFHLSTLDEMLRGFGISYFHATPVNLALILTIILAFVIWLIMFRTRFGHEMRCVGFGVEASKMAGLRVRALQISAFALAGAIAGFVGVNEVMGHEHRFIQGFSPQYGFTGIAVALLGRKHPFGVVAAGLLFGILHNMSREIEFATNNVSKELAWVIQAVLILCVALEPYLKSRFVRRHA